jgi:uncharacterized protein YecE (DUF72 family)
MAMDANAGRIRVGVGGWTYEPWRGIYYPKGLPQAEELKWSSRQLTAIEINGTFYRTQTRASFEKWRDETPDDFVFAVKAPRAATNRRVLAEAKQSIDWFFASGIDALGPKLGPILWQFAPTKKFDPADFAAFLALLPKELAGRPLRHAVEPRHPTFETVEFVELARRHGVAIVFADTDDYPSFADLTADFVYSRWMRSEAQCTTGYESVVLDDMALVAQAWAAGYDLPALPHVAPPITRSAPRDVFCFVISGAKERAPAAAQALIARLRAS